MRLYRFQLTMSLTCRGWECHPKCSMARVHHHPPGAQRKLRWAVCEVVGGTIRMNLCCDIFKTRTC